MFHIVLDDVEFGTDNSGQRNLKFEVVNHHSTGYNDVDHLVNTAPVARWQWPDSDT
jgi:hypothetical protein